MNYEDNKMAFIGKGLNNVVAALNFKNDKDLKNIKEQDMPILKQTITKHYDVNQEILKKIGKIEKRLDIIEKKLSKNN